MSPVIGALVVFWIIRAMNGAGKTQRGNSGASASSGGTWSSGQGTEVSLAVVVLILKVVVFAVAHTVAVDFAHPAMVYLLDIVAVPVALPTLFLRYAIVPLGWYRFAYWWFRCTWPFGFGKEFRTGALYYATLAVARKTALAEPAQLAWLRQRLPFTSVNTIAHDTIVALHTALAGDRDTARTMLHSLDTTRGPRWIRCVARDWLVTDAVGRGDWPAVVRCGRRGRDSFRWSYAVARMAQRMDRSAQAAPNWLLIVLWLWAPRRRQQLPFLRSALAVPRGPQSPASAWPAPADLPAALADLASMLLQMAKTGQEPQRAHFLAIVQRACAQLESPQIHAHVQQRLKALDPLRSDAQSAVDAIVYGAHQQLVELVIPLIEKSPHLVQGQDHHPVLRDALDRVRQSALQDIELRCRDYEQRTASQTSLEPQEEWKTWALLQKQANHLLQLDHEADDALFEAMYGPVCNFAAFQHNVAKHLRLAHDMFSWLKPYATSNPEAGELLARNMAAYPLCWKPKKHS